MKTIGIIAAMQVELDQIIEVCGCQSQQTIKDKQFYITTINGNKVISVLCGIGKVSAAFTTTLLIDHFNCDLVINVGTAGGLQQCEEVLDVVIADKISQYDMDIKDMNNGFNAKDNFTVLQANPYYINLAKQCFTDSQHKCFIAPITTGDTFVYTKQHLERIFQDYKDAYAAEMEGGAVAHVCQLCNVDWVIIRSLSDIAIKDSNDITFEEYKKKASERAALMCKQFISKIN